MDETRIVKELEIRLKKSKKLSKNDLLCIKSIAANPLSQKLIQAFTINGELCFESLITSLQSFVSTSTLEFKLQLLFKLYDTDNDGYICDSELFDMLYALNGQNLDASKIQNIVDKTFRCMGEYQTKMDFSQFTMLIESRNINLDKFFKCN